MSNKNEPKVAVVSRFGRIRFIQIVPMSDGIIIAAVAFFFIVMVNLAILALNILILLVVTAFTGSKGARIASISVLLSIFLIVGLIVHSSIDTTNAQLSQQNGVQQTVSDQTAASPTSTDSTTGGSSTTTNTSLDSTIPPPGYDTGIVINAGDKISISATGWVTYGTNPDGTCDGTPLVNPDGQRQYPNGGLSCDPRMDQYTIVQNAPVGELLAGVFPAGTNETHDGGEYTAVGSNGNFTTQSSGHLYLLMNESTYNNNGGWTDDSGSYKVTVMITPA